MKRNIFFRATLTLVLAVLIAGCGEDETATTDFDFATIASSHYEADGDTELVIPMRGNLPANTTFVYDGSASEEDFEVIGLTDEGLRIRIFNDIYADNGRLETIRITMVVPGQTITGNAIHTVTIIGDCNDTGNLGAAYFEGKWSAEEDYGSTHWGPYEINFEVDPANPNRLWVDNFWDSGLSAYIDVDVAARTVHFPNQSTGGFPISNSTGTFCADDEQLTISLLYRNGTANWTYHFTRDK